MSHDRDEDGVELLGSGRDETEPSPDEALGLVYAGLSGILFSVVSVLLKVSAWRVDVLQVSWLSALARICVATGGLPRKHRALLVVRCACAWLGSIAATFAVSALDLGSATSILSTSGAWAPVGGLLVGERLTAADVAVIVLSALGIACVVRGPVVSQRAMHHLYDWAPYAAAIGASLCSAAVGFASRALARRGIRDCGRATALFGVVFSPLAILFTDEPVRKLRGPQPWISTPALAACVGAGLCEVAAHRCGARAKAPVAPAVVRALNIVAAFAWQEVLLFDDFPTPAPDTRAMLGAVLVIAGILGGSVAKHRRMGRRHRRSTSWVKSGSESHSGGSPGDYPGEA